jgi:hypothetical protein
MHRFAVSTRTLLSAAFVVAAPLAAQSVHVKVNVPDSIAHIVDRPKPAQAKFAIVSRDSSAMLLLMDTTIVAQMTDRELAKMNSKEATDTISGVMNRMIARMALGALAPIFDHGVAYHLRDLGDARYANGKLLLLRKNGDEVFKNTELGHGQLMASFAPADAKEFAKRAKEARAKLK